MTNPKLKGGKLKVVKERYYGTQGKGYSIRQKVVS